MIEWKATKLRDSEKEWGSLRTREKTSKNKNPKWKHVARFNDPDLAKRVARLLTNQEKWQEETKNLEEPSIEFKQALIHTSSCSILCELCGREHFCNDDKQAGEYSDKDWQKLLDDAERDPDKYQYHDDYIEWGSIDGKQVVVDCPCNRSTRYERWIISHRRIISDFLKARAKRLMEEAKEEAEVSTKAEDIVKYEDEDTTRIRRPTS